MLEFISSLELSTWQWFLFILCGVLIGMAKTGLSGAGLMVVPIMAGIFGGKASVGIVLPMLIFADIFAVNHYNKHTNWRYVFLLLPWAMGGIILGAIFGNKINDVEFKKVLALIIVVGIAIMLWKDIWGKNAKIPDNWWFAAILGLAGGFTTMVGNAAGPVMSLYLLSMLLPKNSYIGTGAWFFLLVNSIKIPFHIFLWKTINAETLLIDLLVIPGILAGVIVGIRIVRILPEKAYRVFIILSTVFSALFLF